MLSRLIFQSLIGTGWVGKMCLATRNLRSANMIMRRRCAKAGFIRRKWSSTAAARLWGNSPGELDRAIAGSSPVTGGPAISAAQGNVTIAAAAGQPADTARADIWLVRYDARIQNVAIKSGENSGRTLPHKNIVRQLVKLGGWNGKAVSFALPANPSPHYRNVILVQRVGSGPIISARRI